MKIRTKELYVKLVVMLMLSMFNYKCDPLAPSPSGIISIANNINVSDYQYLCIVNFADPRLEFSIVNQNFTNSDYYINDCVSLNNITFPYDYMIANMGFSDFQDWIVVAWLSNISDNYSIYVGDAYGSQRYEPGSCWFDENTYCEVVSGVDIVIDKIAYY